MRRLGAGADEIAEEAGLGPDSVERQLGLNLRGLLKSEVSFSATSDSRSLLLAAGKS